MTPTTPRFPMSTPESTPAPNGRDSHGRFAKGNAGGPGNPHARQVAALRRTLLQLVTEEEITAIAKALLAQAKQGNVAAAKLLFSYTLGQPAPAVDPDRLPEHELHTLNANFADPEAVSALLNRQSLETFLPVLQIAMACQQQQLQGHLSDRLAQAEHEDQKKQQRQEKRQARRAGAAVPSGPSPRPAAAEAIPQPVAAPSGNGDNGVAPARPAKPAGSPTAPSGNGSNGAAPARPATAPSGNGSNGAPPAAPAAPPASPSAAWEATAPRPEPPSINGTNGHGADLPGRWGRPNDREDFGDE